MAQSGGIAQSAFNGCTQLNTIEFDFTTETGKNLGDANLGEGDNSAITALTHIYQMFAASEDNFSNNGSIDANTSKPTKEKAWLPTTAPLGNSNFDNTNKAYQVNFNGIKWSAKVAASASGGVEFVRPTAQGNVVFTPGKD